MTKISRILLDMDEVLVDFVGGAAKRWGLTRLDLLPYWPEGRWDMLPALGAALGREGPLGIEEFWKELDGSEQFWLDLSPLPWLSGIIEIVEEITNDWHVVSAPSRCDSSYSGKVKWLKRLFGSSFDRFALTPHKYIFARPDVLLIDDRDDNVMEFQAKGGLGIVFPAHNNSRAEHANDPVSYLELVLGIVSHKSFNR